jgi:zinc protease
MTLISTAIAASTKRLNSPTLHRHSSGLTIIAEQIPVDAVNLNLWLNVGSAVESDAINGMAHFLEHMIFKGTDRLKSGEFEAQIEQRGAVTNAATSQDYTHYYITTAPQDFAELAPLQLDVLFNPRIPEDGFARERHVVLEEIRRGEDNARRRTYQHMVDVGYDHLPYRRPVLGPTSVIEQLEAQQMRDFHRQWYHPQDVIAVAVGNLPVEELIRIVEKGYESIAGTGTLDRGISPNYKPEAPFTSVVRRDHRDKSLQQARMMMLWRVPGLLEMEETYALDVLANFLGHGRTARLVKDLREDRALVNSIGTSNVSHQYQGLFCLSAHLAAENMTQVERACLDHIETLQTDLVSAADLDKICTQVANQFIFANETPSDRANLYGYYQAMMGDLAPAFEYTDRIRSLTPEDIRTAAQKYLKTDAYGFVGIRPE